MVCGNLRPALGDIRNGHSLRRQSMKKKLFVSFLLCAALILCLGAFAFADSNDYVIDEAGLLSQAEYDELYSLASGTSDSFGCGVYIVVVQDYTEYSNGRIGNFSEAVYEDLDFGLGNDRNCIILAMSMKERDFDLCAHGEFGNYAFTDYGKTVLQDYFLPGFREGDWFKGFKGYIEGCRYLMTQAANGEPVDVIVYDDGGVRYADDGGRGFVQWMIIILAPMVIAGAVCGIFASQMKTAKLRTEAAEYTTDENIRIATEHYTHSTEVRTKIKKDDDSHSGGTSVNSGGFSHSSGKF